MFSEQEKKILLQTVDIIKKHLDEHTDSAEVILIPFGKHKGENIENVPATYLDWLRDQEFVKEQHPKIWKYITDNEDVIDSEIDDELPF